ncbi:MAG: hypothetical protein U0871_01825 [Gemmataceae bacterium]
MRYLKLALVAVVGTVGVAAATDARSLPELVEWTDGEATRADQLAVLDQHVRAQALATDDIIARLADGRFTLAEAVEQLDANTRCRPAFREAVGLSYPGAGVRSHLAGYLLARVGDRLGNDPGRLSALEAEARELRATDRPGE